MRQFTEIIGVVLAGGRGSRMGGADKGLMLFRGQPLYIHIVDKLQPQVAEVVISANRNIEIYRQKNLQIIGDALPDFPGPLAGMLAVMQATESKWYLFCPCDTPNIPCDLATKLWEARGDAPAVWVNDGSRDHPGIVLIHRGLAGQLQDYLHSGERRVMQFLRQAGGKAVLFSNQTLCFANINTPEDLADQENKQ